MVVITIVSIIHKVINIDNTIKVVVIIITKNVHSHYIHIYQLILSVTIFISAYHPLFKTRFGS